MPIIQMNYGLMKFDADDPRMSAFNDNLAALYRLAEVHPGFIWRMPDDEVAHQIGELGHSARMSATVSMWDSVDALKDYTFNSLHGQFVTGADAWFEKIETPQLVIWDVVKTERPNFREAFDRLDHLIAHGPTSHAYGWTFARP